MPPSLRELIPGYNPQAGLGELIPGYASAAPLPTLRSPETQQMEDVAAARDMSELAKGYKSSRLNSAANYLASRESTLRRMGDVAGADQLRNEIGATQLRAQTFAPSEDRVENLQWDPQRIGNRFASGVGQVGGSMVDSLASGAAAGYAAKGIGLIPHPLAKAIGAAAPLIGAGAAAVPNVLNMRGETLNDMNSDRALMARTTPAERDNTAWLSGGAQGLVDTAVPGVMVNHLLGSGLKKGVHALSAAPRVGAMVLGEGTQELTQEAMKKATLGYLNPERDTAGDMSDYGNALASGVFMAPHAAASVGIDNAFRRLGTKGDGKNGDAIPLDEKPAVDLESHLIEGSKQKLASHVIADQRRQFLLGDMPPEAVAAPEAWLAENEPKRQAALLEELGKLANDPKAKQLAQQVSAVDLSDPLNSMHPAMDEAAEYVVDKSGLTLEASREAIDKKAAAAGKNKKKNAMAVAGMRVENHDKVYGHKATPFGGPKAPADDSKLPTWEGRPPEATMTTVSEPAQARKDPDKEIAKARVWLANDILRQNYVKLGGKTSSDHMDLLSNLSDEIGAMASPGVVKYPTTGDINRAQRVGQTISELLGDQAKDVLDHIGRVVRAKGAAFEAMVERAISPVKVSSLDRTTAADELVKLIPAPVEARLYAKGIDLSSGEAKERLLRNMEDFADGTSGFALEPARKLFGAETFDAMLAHVGQPIIAREKGPTKLGSLVDDRQAEPRNPKSSDDIGGSWDAMNEGRRGDEDLSQFEIEGEEKSLSAIPPEAMVFHHGTREGTVRTLENAWKETKDGLPQLLRLDTSTKKRDSETHEQHEERTAPGGAERMLAKRIEDVRSKAEKSLGAMRDRYVVASTTAKDLMDRQNMQPSKRAELFLRYLEKEKHPGVGEVSAMHGVLRELEHMNRVMTEFVAHRDSLSPSGKKLSINERNALGGPRISLARLKELLSPQDADKVDALVGGDKESGAKGEQQTVRRVVGLAKIIHNATLAARQHMNDTMAQDPLIKSYMGKVQKERSTPAEFDEVVNHFFSEHHLVTAEQGTNRDHLQMNLMEFREMAIKGAKNLKSAWLAVKHLPLKEQAKQRAAVEASMNLIRFSSEHSTAEDKQIAIPAHMLVAWVREMRNAHEQDVVEGGGDVRGKSRSKTRTTEDYKRDLLEGITALMQGGLTDGLPYIINEKGVREDFGTPVDMLPPSLDLDGTTQQKAMRDRAIGAEKRREANRPVLGRSLREAAVKHIEAKAEEAAEDALKDAELSQDPSDVQDVDAVKKAEDEASGARTRDEERRYVKQLASIMEAAADAPVRPMSYGQALNSAAKVAERLWRAYAPRSVAEGAQEAHKAALASILAYARSASRDTYNEDPNGMVGGPHYIFPLAALLTPRHMADIATKHPDDLKLFTMLRSRVANDLVLMAKPPKGNPTISGANLSKLVNFLSGQTDLDIKERLDAKVPTDPDQLDAWKESRKSETKWEGRRVPMNQQIEFLNNMAADYVAMAARRAAKPVVEKVEATDRSGKLGHNDKKAVVGEIGERAAQAGAEQAKAELIDKFILDLRAKITNDEGAYPAALKVEAKIRRAAKMREDLDGRKPAPALAPATKGSDKGKPVRLTIKQRLIERKENAKQRDARVAQELADSFRPSITTRSTERGADGRIKMTDEQVKADTAAANEGVDKLVKVIENTLEAKPMAGAALPKGQLTRSGGVELTGGPTFAMNYADGQRVVGKGTLTMRPEHAGKDTMDLILSGDRTATTGSLGRFNGAKKGDVVMATGNGKRALIRFTSDPYPVAKMDAQEWSRLEGWAPEVLEKYRGDYQATYERVSLEASGVRKLNAMAAKAEPAVETAKVRIRQHASAGFAERTKENADAAGATVAIATNFETAGERLTRRVAGDKYFALGFDVPIAKAGLRLAKFMRGKDTTTLNVAGNGIYTLAESGMTQQDVNQHVHDIIAAAHKLWPITHIVSGGQTGVDIAGAVAAKALGIPATITLPQGFRQRNVANQDVNNTAAQIGQQIMDGVAGLNGEAEPASAPNLKKSSIKHNAETIDAAQVRLNTAPDAKAIEVSGAIAHFKRTLGPQVRLMLEDAFPGMKGLADWDAVQHLARISTANPLKIMQLAYHESMHAFFSTVLDKHPEAKAMLERAMGDAKVVARLEHLLRHSPDAIADMKADPEERVAYAYQFWAAGLLDIDKKPATFFEKVQALMRRVFGAVRDSEKALAIFEGFHKGTLKEPSAAGLAITKVMQTGEWKTQFLKRFDKQWQAIYSEVMTAHDVLRTSESPTLRMLATAWWANPGDPDSAGKTGVIDRRGIKTNQYESQLDSVLGLFEGPNQDRDLKALSQFMNGMNGEYSEEIKAAGNKLHNLMANFYTYAKKAGVEMGVRDNGNFYPVVYDLEKMIENKSAFTKMLIENYSHVLQSALGTIRMTDKNVTTLEQVADAMHQAIVDRGGVDQEGLEAHREDGILNPYFASQNKRSFDWISKEHRSPFLSDDIVATTTRYFHQGVRSAEYVRAFGNGGQKLKDLMAREGEVQMVTKESGPVLYFEDGPVVKELRAEAAKQGLKGVKAEEWVNRRVEDAQRAMGAMEGVLGKNITAGTRKLHSAMMVYQALRTLPLSLFSAMLDPNGIKVAGGTTQNMLDAYVHGLKNVVGTWKDVLLGNSLRTRGDEQDTINASIVGSIAPTVFLEGRGAAHTSEYTAGPARKINRGLFLGNGLTMWDRSMRIMATKAAMQSIANNEKNAVPEHSARWLKELGLKQGEVKLGEDGLPIITAHGLAAYDGRAWSSLNETQQDMYREQVLKVHTAINRWVNRAITSPNAAQRPSRMSDPHYAMFFQLKSFTYAFQKTTMNYALNEAKAGNPAALGQVAVGMPIMIAADVAKAMLTGGGSLPGYMANWTMADWISHAWDRSGGNGIGQFGADILHDPNGLIAGTASVVGGPPVSQAINALTHPIGETIYNATPIVNKLGGLGKVARGMADMGE